MGIWEVPRISRLEGVFGPAKKIALGMLWDQDAVVRP